MKYGNNSGHYLASQVADVALCLSIPGKNLALNIPLEFFGVREAFLPLVVISRVYL
jgi:hypothetical protein